MKVLSFEVGDSAWLYRPYNQGKMTLGRVIAVVDLPEYQFPHYVIEVQTCTEPELYIRDGLALSESENRPVGMMRKR